MMGARFKTGGGFDSVICVGVRLGISSKDIGPKTGAKAVVGSVAGTGNVPPTVASTFCVGSLLPFVGPGSVGDLSLQSLLPRQVHGVAVDPIPGDPPG